MPPHKYCPHCGQPAVLSMPRCRRCGASYAMNSGQAVRDRVVDEMIRRLRAEVVYVGEPDGRTWFAHNRYGYAYGWTREDAVEVLSRITMMGQPALEFGFWIAF